MIERLAAGAALLLLAAAALASLLLAVRNFRLGLPVMMSGAAAVLLAWRSLAHEGAARVLGLITALVLVAAAALLVAINGLSGPPWLTDSRPLRYPQTDLCDCLSSVRSEQYSGVPQPATATSETNAEDSRTRCPHTASPASAAVCRGSRERAARRGRTPRLPAARA